MAILRKHQRSQYTVIDNTIFRDRSLSNKALGMLCRMLSLPDGWDFSVAGLAALSTDGKSAVTSQLEELESKGYLVRNRVRKNGKIVGVEYIVSETKMSDFPYLENPYMENPYTENQAQSNTKESNTKGSITKESYISEFENLWSMYPKRQGKKKAYDSYVSARKKGSTYEEVKQGIENYIAYIEAKGTDMQYVKMGSTFFNQRAWEDDWTVPKRSTGNPFLDMLEEGDY